MEDRQAIRDRLFAYLSKEVLSPEARSQIDDRTPLYSSGLLDSIEQMKLISFLEKSFGVVVTGKQVENGRLESIESMLEMIQSRGSKS
jgi:acyl carrier protein